MIFHIYFLLYNKNNISVYSMEILIDSFIVNSCTKIGLTKDMKTR